MQKTIIALAIQGLIRRLEAEPVRYWGPNGWHTLAVVPHQPQYPFTFPNFIHLPLR